jgi:hypothetical protein
MDLWTASYTEAGIVGLCLLTLVIGLRTSRRQQRTVSEIRLVRNPTRKQW